MNTFNASKEFDSGRRRFLGTAAAAAIAGTFSLPGSAVAQSNANAATVGSLEHRTSFGPLKQIAAGLLNVGYAESGPSDGPAVILLHGWPYDIYSFVDVAPLLASKGYRVIVWIVTGLFNICDAAARWSGGSPRPLIGSV